MRPRILLEIGISSPVQPLTSTPPSSGARTGHRTGTGRPGTRPARARPRTSPARAGAGGCSQYPPVPEGEPDQPGSTDRATLVRQQPVLFQQVDPPLQSILGVR